VDPRGTVTSVRSPFADSFEVGSEEAWIGLGGGARGGEGKDMGGIKVHRTVEISSVQESDEEGVAGLGSPGGSRMERSETDLV
jgi:hypothetical protein